MTLKLSSVPPRDPATLHVERLKAGQELLCHAVSQSVFGLTTHWNESGRHSLPCTSVNCPGCKKGLPARWKGFLHVIRCSDRKQLLVELTSTATALLHDQVPQIDQLRGYRLRIYRGRGADNSRLRCELYGEKMQGLVLPSEIDLIPSLRKIWRGVPDLDLDTLTA